MVLAGRFGVVITVPAAASESAAGLVAEEVFSRAFNVAVLPTVALVELAVGDSWIYPHVSGKEEKLVRPSSVLWDLSPREWEREEQLTLLPRNDLHRNDSVYKRLFTFFYQTQSVCVNR